MKLPQLMKSGGSEGLDGQVRLNHDLKKAKQKEYADER